MTSQSEPLTAAALTTPAMNSGFRLGEDQFSDASDSDQSARSEGSISLSGSTQRMSKTKRRKARKEVGALRHELDDLLSAAFKPKTGTEDANVNIELEIPEPSMQKSSAESKPKKMSRKTRNNLRRMHQRRELKEQRQQAKMKDVVPTSQPLEGDGQSQRPVKKSTSQLRKEKKLRARERARLATEGGDAMDLE